MSWLSWLTGSVNFTQHFTLVAANGARTAATGNGRPGLVGVTGAGPVVITYGPNTMTLPTNGTSGIAVPAGVVVSATAPLGTVVKYSQ